MSIEKHHENKIAFDAVLSRLKGLMNVRRNADVARGLGVDPRLFETWKMRKHVPIKELVAWCWQNNISLDYVVLGRTGDNSLREAGVVDENVRLRQENTQYRAQIERLKRQIREQRIMHKAFVEGTKHPKGGV